MLRNNADAHISSLGYLCSYYYNLQSVYFEFKVKYRQKWVKLVDDLMMKPAKTSVTPRSSPLGTFPVKETRETCETSTAAKSEESQIFFAG